MGTTVAIAMCALPSCSRWPQRSRPSTVASSCKNQTLTSVHTHTPSARDTGPCVVVAAVGRGSLGRRRT